MSKRAIVRVKCDLGTSIGAFALFALASGCGAQAPSEQSEGSAEVGQVSEDVRSARLCAGPRNLSCGAGEYCNARAEGRCPGPRQLGVCATRPQICPDIFKQVCGCDGKSYSNACFAAGAGVAVLHEGACAPQGPFCGGIAGIPCPGAGRCVDDPTDSCDPNQGGADCGGICQCIQTQLCIRGTHFDNDPNVCACVPDTNPCAAALCPVGTQCVPQDGKPVCQPIGARCGPTTCAAGQVCCNASCGICTPPGGVCIQVACTSAS